MQTEVERELVLKCMSGDARYYEPLVRAYEPAVRRIALGILGNAEDAQKGLAQLRRLRPNLTLSVTQQTFTYRRAEDTARLIEGLRRAGLSG